MLEVVDVLWTTDVAGVVDASGRSFFRGVAVVVVVVVVGLVAQDAMTSAKAIATSGFGRLRSCGMSNSPSEMSMSGLGGPYGLRPAGCIGELPVAG